MNPLIAKPPSPVLAEQLAVARAAIGERGDAGQRADWARAWADFPHPQQLDHMLVCSPFVADQLVRNLPLVTGLVISGGLTRRYDEGEYRQQLASLMAREGAQLLPTLRYFRAQHMVRIVWRDFCRLAPTQETTRDTSLLAEACIEVALDYCQRELVQRFGTPRGRYSGKAQELLVLAMGKLGARELNVSSDIDLIFAYPEAGETDGEKRHLSNEEFFTRLGRSLINALDQSTADGFVFRVDMRLRPYGESGPLAQNFAALEDYYQEQGRDWERYALIKARAVTGSQQYSDELFAMLRPFIYRRYIDFGVIESLRSMKQMINAEVRRRGLDNNVKLGHGGIREVEFIAQCFQLIRGGRDRGLQQRELLPVLAECAGLGILPASDARNLREAYLYLRDSEHAIQGYRDQQSQTLPDDAVQQAAMARIMGEPDWPAYLARLDSYRQQVAEHFRNLISDPSEDAGEDHSSEPLWGEGLCPEALAARGYHNASDICEQLQELHDSKRVMALQVQGRERLEEFMPRLVQACAELEDPDTTLARVLPLVVAVSRRSAYLALLLENPAALNELVTLCEASPWIAEQMASHPVLLDELLDRASLYTAPDKGLLQDELRQRMGRLPVDDLEAQMDALRYFKASHTLRVAASETTGRLPLMQVSDKLTWLAEVILEQVLAMAWYDLTSKYGEPARTGKGYGFAVFGYGKLGGIELSYSSDLDLVFLYDGEVRGSTCGERSIDNAVFYTRLGQRIIHILETRMALGQLYEVDMRLRPSGESGMLAASTTGFDHYQQESAWTWEHQALVRARLVAGDEQVGQTFSNVRKVILGQPRDLAELIREVMNMRQRMREHLLPAAAETGGRFHLKQGRGGIVDIEFMVQYAVLAWSHQVPELLRWSDNIRILETLSQQGLFAQSESEALSEAYLAFRSAAHQLALQQQVDVVDAKRFSRQRDAVIGKWQQLFAACVPASTGDGTGTD
ncbi:MAG: bifunctional [glutamate--ammonia ligase]-adenylyl-L-tyrosine phosphorylase/[glutamate--ammonia-ligase] adenylyltransferase [Parahaliea sp.]